MSCGSGFPLLGRNGRRRPILLANLNDDQGYDVDQNQAYHEDRRDQADANERGCDCDDQSSRHGRA